MKTLWKSYGILFSIILVLSLAIASCAPAATEAPAAEAPAAEAPAAEALATEAPATEAPAAEAPKELTKVTLRLNYLPQTEYAGSFIALWNGYYEEEGLDVEIRGAGQELNSISAVASGGDTFGISEPHTVIISRAQGVPMKHIFQGDTDAYLRYVVKKSSGITKIEDLRGKTVSLWLGGAEWEMLCMLRKAGIDPEKDVNIVAQRVGLVPFYENQVDLAQVTTFNELQQIYKAGYSPDDIIVFRAADYGCGLVGNGIMTLEDTVKNQPDVVQGFVNATARGWKWAFEHPKETVEMFIKEYPELDYGGQLLMLEEERKLYLGRNAGTLGVGYLDPDYLTEAQAVILDNKLIDSPVDLSEIYASEFWENIPDEYKIVK